MSFTTCWQPVRKAAQPYISEKHIMAICDVRMKRLTMELSHCKATQSTRLLTEPGFGPCPADSMASNRANVLFRKLRSIV